MRAELPDAGGARLSVPGGDAIGPPQRSKPRAGPRRQASRSRGWRVAALCAFTTAPYLRQPPDRRPQSGCRAGQQDPRPRPDHHHPERLHPPLRRRPPCPGTQRSFIEPCCADAPHERYTTAADALEAFDLLSPADREDDRLGQGIAELVAQWEAAPLAADDAQRDAILNLLLRRRDEEELFYRGLPRLPRALIEQMASSRPDEFRQVIAAYDRHIEGSLPIDYVDVAADFYAVVFEAELPLETARYRRCPTGAGSTPNPRLIPVEQE
ncbi:MAG: hypothetical protein JWM93_793 [Frankiales bacterium]|nr:hypothetical protein [Frankiales bacterium]